MKKLLLLLLIASCSTVKKQDECDLLTNEQIENVSSCVAIKEKPLFGVFFAWADNKNIWRPDEDGYVRLSVSFLDGTTGQKQKTWDRIKLVDDLTEGLQVKMAEANEVSDIRVSFRGRGHWSYLGRTSANIPYPKVTLNISLSGADTGKEWDRVAIHEFLHALGFEHEHQHPNNTIRWNKERVYQYYQQTQGWDRSDVDYQVLNRGSGDRMRTSGFDKDSIMMYPVDPTLTTNKFYVGWNTSLTPCDVSLLKELYPAPKNELR